MFNLKQAWDIGYLSASMSHALISLMIPHNKKLLKCCLCCCIGLLKCRPLPPRAVVLVDCAKCLLLSLQHCSLTPKMIGFQEFCLGTLMQNTQFGLPLFSIPFIGFSATSICYVWSNIDHVITLSTWIIWTRQENAFLLLPLLLL